MCFATKTLGVNLENLFGSRGAGGELSAFCDNLNAADRLVLYNEYGIRFAAWRCFEGVDWKPVMLITEMTRKASLELVGQKKFGRLACAHDGQPYITPVNFALGEGYLYCASTVGRKIEWMRINPLVCVHVDELSTPQKWLSVIVFGRYEELPDNPEHDDARRLAYALLQLRPVWWEPGYVKTILDGEERRLEPLYFRVRIDEISGHRGAP